MKKEALKEEKLLDFLLNNFDYSNKKIKKILTSGNVMVDNKVITQFDHLLKPKQIVSINIYNKSNEIDIIYENDDIIVVSKKPGLLTIKDNNDNISLYELVSKYVKLNNKNNKIFIVHRLDRETSGIVLFAKNERIKKLLQENWNNLAIERKYVALVHGKAKDNEIIKSNLKENKAHYVYISPIGDMAITEYTKIKEKENISLIDINIKTGRKNQIRVQLKSKNLPILGDKKYGIKDNYDRLYLHAYKLVIINPINNKKMVFETDIPKNFIIK